MRAATASRPEFGANFDRDGLFSSGSHAHAGYSPWPGGLGGVLPGAPGVSVVHFSPIRPHHRTGLLPCNGYALGVQFRP